MKKIILSCFLILLGNCLLAQQNGGVVITRDTINISGYVYNYDGTPCANVTLQSRQKDTVYNAYSLRAITDKNGYFKIKGAKFNDTISVITTRIVSVFNRGSRYIVLYMPPPHKLDILQMEVAARRTHPKPTFKFITKKQEPLNPNFRYEVFEMEPLYPGGPLRYKEEVLKKLIYPEKAIENNIEGTVEIGFTILRDGTISNYKVLKGIGYGCEDEVIQVMKSIKRWKPGILDNVLVEFNYMIDVEFKLTDN